MEGVFIEFILAVIAVTVFLFSGNIHIQVALAWTAGSLLGGFFGGKLVKRTSKLSPTKQKYLLRATFVVALGIALWNVFLRV